jgi:hypothetical protein
MSSTGTENTTRCHGVLNLRAGYESHADALNGAKVLAAKYNLSVNAGNVLKAADGSVGVPPYARDIKASCDEGHFDYSTFPFAPIHHESCPLRRIADEHGLEFDQCVAGCVFTAPTPPSTT